jgi:hypothetical protein
MVRIANNTTAAMLWTYRFMLLTSSTQAICPRLCDVFDVGKAAAATRSPTGGISSNGHLQTMKHKLLLLLSHCLLIEFPGILT